MQDLPGKVAVVTGAASGIGAAMAEAFVGQGMAVVLADVDEERLAEVEHGLAQRGGDVRAVRCDTSVEADVQSLAAATLERHGRVHVLCNNAGIGGLGDAWSAPMDLWERVVGVNLFGVVHGIRAFLPTMTAQGEGHIVNTASMAGLIAMPGAAPYNATKHAVVALSEGLYVEMQATATGIGVTVLCPGWVRTRLVANETGTAETPMAVMIGEVARHGVEDEGIEPAEVADQVVAAIRADRFWVLTHPETRSLPVARMQRAADGVNPTLGPP